MNISGKLFYVGVSSYFVREAILHGESENQPGYFAVLE